MVRTHAIHAERHKLADKALTVCSPFDSFCELLHVALDALNAKPLLWVNITFMCDAQTSFKVACQPCLVD